MAESFARILPPAPAERAAETEIQAQVQLFRAIPLFQSLIDAVPGLISVLNQQRQLVAANRALLEEIGAESVEEVQGLRNGEVYGCVQALENAVSCGSSAQCSVCGGLRAIVSSQMGQAQRQLCRMRLEGPQGGETLELDMTATPIEVEGQRFTLLHSVKADDRLSRERLEQFLLPRMQELATEVDAVAERLSFGGLSDANRVKALDVLAGSARRFAALTDSEKEMAAAEAGSIHPAFRRVAASALIREAILELGDDEASRERNIHLEEVAEDIFVTTVARLARHALKNALVNALEATPAGASISVVCAVLDTSVEYRIHNDSEMPRQVQLQVFQRSFTTKGPGRGYGTYLMRLLAKRYLKGNVWFESGGGMGTTFVISLPRAVGQGSGT